MDSLVRKQCLFLLQKAIDMCRMTSEKVHLEKPSSVFWYDPEENDTFFKTWQQYVFLLETLEEKQVGLRLCNSSLNTQTLVEAHLFCNRAVFAWSGLFSLRFECLITTRTVRKVEIKPLNLNGLT